MDLFGHLHSHDYGELHFRLDKATGLRSIIAIHDTRLGPALGGCRFLPYDSEEAAVIDGCSSWQVLTRIYLAAIRPAVVTVALFAFVTSWNEFLAALVIMNRGATFTLPLVLAAARQETSIGGTDWGLLQAGVTIAVIPCVLFYLLLQKYYVSGFLSGAVK